MISIITPTYNRAHLISKCIKSVQVQIFRNWELLIIDDGSTDNTQEVINPFLKDNRIKYIQKENTGAAHSRNVGVDNSTYDWVIFLDSDDTVKNEWLSEFVNLIDSNPNSVLFSVGVSISYDDKILDHSPKENKFFKGEHITRFNAGAYLLKKSVFNEIGGFDNKLQSNQHTDLSIRLLEFLNKEDLKSSFSKRYLIQIDKHSDERIQNNWNAVLSGTLYMIKKYKQNIFPNKLTSQYYNVASYAALNSNQKLLSVNLNLSSIRYNPFNLKLYAKLLYLIFFKW